MSARVSDVDGIRCQRCGGSGCTPIIVRGPFVEDTGLVKPDLRMEMCETCLGSGYIDQGPKKEKTA